MRWIKNWFNYQDQEIVISSTQYSWKPVSTGVPQRLTVGPGLLNLCINNVSDETELSFSKAAGGAELGGAFWHQKAVLPFRRTWAVGGP